MAADLYETYTVTLAVFRFCCPFHDTGDLPELTSNFFNNTTGCFTNSFHEKRAEVVRKQTTNKETGQYQRV